MVGIYSSRRIYHAEHPDHRNHFWKLLPFLTQRATAVCHL